MRAYEDQKRMDDQSKRQIEDLIYYHESRQEEAGLKKEIEKACLQSHLSKVLLTSI